jgi:hypothetical protein
METRFWRMIAVAVVVGLFYVGHGLHQGSADGLLSTADAQTMVYFDNSDGGSTPPILFTQSQDGSKIYAWRIRPHQVSSRAKGAVRSLGSWTAD